MDTALRHMAQGADDGHGGAAWDGTVAAVDDSQHARGEDKLPFFSRPAAVILLVACGLFVDYLLLTIVIPILPSTLKGSGTSHRMIGLLFSSKAMAQGLTNPFMGLVTDLSGPVPPLALGHCVLLASALVSSSTKSYWVLFAARCVSGVGSAACMTGGMALIARVFRTHEERSKAVGDAMAGVALAVLSGPPLGSLLYDTEGYAAPFYLVASLAGTALCMLTAIVVSRRRHAAREWRSVEDDHVHVGHVLRHRLVVAFLAVLFIANSAIAMLEPSMPLFLAKKFDISSSASGYVFAASAVGYAIGTPLVGHLGTKVQPWKLIIPGLGVLGTSFLLVGTPNVLVGVIFVLLGVGVGMSHIDPTSMCELGNLVDVLFPGKSSYGAVYALGDLALCAGYTVGPILGSWVVGEVHYDAAFQVFGGACIAIIPLVVWIGRERGKLPTAHREQLLN